jgi:hypothetical protein
VTTGEGRRQDLSYSADNAGHVPQPWSEYLLVTDQWKREIEGYGWADQQAGTVRVPVEHAMRVYLERRQAKQQPGAPQAPAAGAQQPPATAPASTATPPVLR